MSEKVFVKPAIGLLVRDPVTMEVIPGEGAEKELNTHWLRREREGDVTLAPVRDVASSDVATKTTKKEK